MIKNISFVAVAVLALALSSCATTMQKAPEVSESSYWHEVREGCRFVEDSELNKSYSWSGQCKGGFVEGCGTMITSPDSPYRRPATGCYVAGKRQGTFVTVLTQFFDREATNVYSRTRIEDSWNNGIVDHLTRKMESTTPSTDAVARNNRAMEQEKAKNDRETKTAFAQLGSTIANLNQRPSQQAQPQRPSSHQQSPQAAAGNSHTTASTNGSAQQAGTGRVYDGKVTELCVRYAPLNVSESMTWFKFTNGCNEQIKVHHGNNGTNRYGSLNILGPGQSTKSWYLNTKYTGVQYIACKSKINGNEVYLDEAALSCYYRP